MAHAQSALLGARAGVRDEWVLEDRDRMESWPDGGGIALLLITGGGCRTALSANSGDSKQRRYSLESSAIWKVGRSGYQRTEVSVPVFAGAFDDYNFSGNLQQGNQTAYAGEWIRWRREGS